MANLRTALVLGGGGARAAYQVGVLLAIRELLGDSTDNPFPILCGTSAGAVNVATLACNAGNFRAAVDALAEVWRNMHAGHIYRADPLGTGTKLLLAPGTAQIYYGDEVARSLKIRGTAGDATLRGMMPWDSMARPGARVVLEHWRKLGLFRRAHPAIGAGEHRLLQAKPYVFSRVLGSDRVVVALDQPVGKKAIPVGDVFPEGTEVVDAYSGTSGTVTGGRVMLSTKFTVVLLAAR